MTCFSLSMYCMGCRSYSTHLLNKPHMIWFIIHVCSAEFNTFNSAFCTFLYQKSIVISRISPLYDAFYFFVQLMSCNAGFLCLSHRQMLSMLGHDWGMMDPEEAELQNDYRYRSYAAVIEKALRNFESSSEWADLISSLGKLNKVLKA